MEMKAEDLLGTVFARVAELAPEHTKALRAIEQDVRNRWGGDRVYIARTYVETESYADREALRRARIGEWRRRR
jgi:hypothetical protein